MFISLAVGTLFVFILEKWFFIGLVVIYLPLYLIDRQLNPVWPKEILRIFKVKHFTE